MSLYGALFSGVSGLQSQSSAMGAISDNISNVNTTGYKGSKVHFQTLVTKQVALTTYSPGGVQSKPRQGVDVQGLLQASNKATDIALSGEGMFVVNEAANPLTGDLFAYSRAGSFKVDKEGYLQNTGGWYLQGWPLQASDGSPQAVTQMVGNNEYMKSYKNDSGATVYINDNIVSSTHLKPINLNEIGGTATPTQNIRMGANLPSGADIGDNHKTNILIYDSLGNDHNIQFTWSKTATNQWGLEGVPPLGSASMAMRDGSSNIRSAMGRLDFVTEPTAGDSFTMQIDGTTYTFNFNNTGTNDLTDGSDQAYHIDVAGRTYSQTIDAIASAVQDAFNTEYGGTTTYAERIAGTDSIIFRQTDTADAITVNTTGLTANTVLQNEMTFSVAAVNATTSAAPAIAFNGDGTPASIFNQTVDPDVKITIDWVNGAEDMDDSESPAISMFLGNINLSDGMTQLGGGYQINYLTQNGAKFGNFAGVSIGQDGIVTALFDNGVTRPVFMIPVATFINYNGMESLTGNVWIETDNSGQPTLREAGDAGAGQVQSAALEASTVDLGEEFTNMITTQRAYSAAAKIITSADEMLDELVRIKR